MRKLIIYVVSLLILCLNLTFLGQIYGEKNTELTTKNIKSYLNSTKNQIERQFGVTVSTDCSSAIIESYIVFPSIFIKKIGLTFLFINETENIEPRMILIAKESNTTNFNIEGAKPGMKFKQIFNFLGKTKVINTWMANEENTAYMIEYKINGLSYSFVSFEKDGNNSELYIEND